MLGTRLHSRVPRLLLRGAGPLITIGAPADSSGRFRGYIGAKPMGRKEKRGYWRTNEARFLGDALPGGDEDRRQTVIAPIFGGLRNLRSEGRRPHRIGKAKLCAGRVEAVI